jgi:hypothetical protein
MLTAGFEPKMPVFEWCRTIRASDRGSNGAGIIVVVAALHQGIGLPERQIFHTRGRNFWRLSPNRKTPGEITIRDTNFRNVQNHALLRGHIRVR